MRTQITQATVDFIYRAVEELDNKNLLSHNRRHHFHYPWRYRRDDLSVSEAEELILDLEGMAARSEMHERGQLELGEEISPRFPVYSEIVEVAPIYKEAVSLEVHKPIVRPAQIPGLLYLLRIPGHREGMDIENHNFGYHFHYGKLKSEVMIRTNLLFTFNPETPIPPKKKASHELHLPLYFEYHAEGKNKPIDVESIGINKRRPIYLVCMDMGQKRGLHNFKRPAKDSGVFFDSRTHAI